MVTFMRLCIFKIRGTWCHLDSHCECLVYTTSMFNRPTAKLKFRIFFIELFDHFFQKIQFECKTVH